MVVNLQYFTKLAHWLLLEQRNTGRSKAEAAKSFENSLAFKWVDIDFNANYLATCS
jgi:hypothetical protein